MGIRVQENEWDIVLWKTYELWLRINPSFKKSDTTYREKYAENRKYIIQYQDSKMLHTTLFYVNEKHQAVPSTCNDTHVCSGLCI